MKEKDATRVIAGGSLAAILAVHFLPRRLLPLASPALAVVVIIGGLLFVHRNPLRSLWRDVTAALEGNFAGQGALTSKQERSLGPTTDAEALPLRALNEEPSPASQN